MVIKEISIEEYKKMWEDTKGKMQFEAPRIDPVMRNMTVQGYSGPGTPFENEYERLEYEHFNPRMPRQIEMWTEDDLITYIPRRKK